jgi:CRISPR/Cas system CMR-associated protein Cmr3 (group 5 of RAMP superfamily)
MVSRSIYNLKIDTICMYDIPFDRSFLQLSNGIRHVMPSTDTARINSKGIDCSARLTAGCVCQWVKFVDVRIEERKITGF